MTRDPLREGVNTNPPDTLDYQRLVEATDMTVRWDTTTEGATPAEIGKRVDLEAVHKLAFTRAEETHGLYESRRPTANKILPVFVNVWCEGFVTAIVFREQGKETALFGKLPDKNLIGAASNIMRGWGRGDGSLREWNRRIDMETLVHVATYRSVQTIQVTSLERPDRLALVSTQAAHWADGFSMGLLFQELGGHREG